MACVFFKKFKLTYITIVFAFYFNLEKDVLIV